MRKEKKKSKKCTAQSVAKTNLKAKSVENYGEKLVNSVKRLR